MKKIIQLLLLLFISSSNYLIAQGQLYEGPDDPAGDIGAKREGWMTGNRVFLKFNNQVKLADWPGNLDVSQWPNDYSGGQILNGGILMIAGKVFLENDSIPVTDINEINSRDDLQSLYFLEHSIHGSGDDKNPERTLVWTFHPPFGYFNETSDYPAMSNRPDSWPLLGWPSRGDEKKWSGFWNGRFGKGVFYADLETYIVANDAQDQEYLEEEDSVKYYPRRVYGANNEIIKDVRIGDKKADVTVQSGRPWGGMGLRIAMRGYQWSNPQARDAIFFEYDISNISDYDLPMLSFGYDFRIGIGESDGNDEYGYYNKELDLSYSWDRDGIGYGGIRTGTFGMAYLESPGVQNDGIDNDEDGLVDEKRDNLALAMVGPTDGIQDLDKFMKWYGYTEEDLHPHWDADEDQDWMDGFDENNNGRYDLGEDYGHDVGLDGIGPGELNYIGPDEGECNHKPDYLVGLGCEPNFAATDISESDMMGLTTFFMRAIGGGQLNYADDQGFYDIMTSNDFIPEFGSVTNLSMIFSSGVFPLKKGRTERISVGMVHSYEELNALNSSTHDAPSLFQKKKIVQYIYEADYRFAQPPKMPTLTATAGDGKVILTWDDAAVYNTREPLLNNINDFEGYKLYRATDKYFQDAEQLRDMYGEAIGKKPIYQCDLKDNIKGAADFVHINGELYYLGADTGIKNYFVDENVENGRTYYYGLVAYDYGYEGEEVAIMPSENNLVIDIDETENIRFVGKNVQVVVPHQRAAGYVDPSIELLEEESNVHGSGEIIPKIVDINSVTPNHTYKIKFHVNELGNARKNKILRHPLDLVRVNSGFSVYDVTLGDSLLYEESIQYHSMKNILNDGEFKIEDGWVDLEDINYLNNREEIYSDVFAGIQLQMNLKAFVGELSYEKSAWVVGNTEMNITPSTYESGGFPYQYDIIFTNDPAAHTTEITRQSYVFGLNGSTGYVQGSSFVLFEYLINQSFPFYVVNKLAVDSLGQYERVDILVEDVNQNGKMDLLEDRFLVGHSHQVGNAVYWGGTIFGIDFHGLREESQLPKGGDVYRVDFDRPYWTTDSLMFRVAAAEELNEEILREDMSSIKVVPNPYVVTNTMESAVLNWDRNQTRQIMFTHIPAQSKISIFSVSGILIDEIDVDNSVGSRENSWDFNSSANGTVHWDLRSSEGLEIAAGYYIYRVESKVTGDVKVGKFAVIK